MKEYSLLFRFSTILIDTFMVNTQEGLNDGRVAGVTI